MMKQFTIVWAFATCLLQVAVAAPNIPKPEVTIAIANGKFDNLADISPTFKWTKSGKLGSNVEYDAGIDVVVEDLKQLPYNLWAKIKAPLVSGFALAVRGRTSSKNLHNIDLDLTVTGDSTTIQAFGKKTGDTISVDKLLVKQNIPTPVGNVMVNPKYNVNTGAKDISVGYSVAGTGINVDAAAKKLTLKRSFDDGKLSLKPSITASGDFAVDVARDFDKIGTITTSYKPATAINLKWEEGPWIGNVFIPMKGHLSFEPLQVSFKRKVEWK